MKFNSPNIEKVFDHPNCFSIPSIRLICYVPKQGDKTPKQTLDSRLMFISKVERGDPEFNEKCPQCNSTNIQQLRRVTGYLTGDYKTAFNAGKQQETEDRFRHSSLIEY